MIINPIQRLNITAKKIVASNLNEITKSVITCYTKYDNIYKLSKKYRFKRLNKVLS